MTNHEPSISQSVDTTTAEVPTAEPRPAAAQPWQAKAHELMRQVAALCVEHGVDADTFMKSAWMTYVDTRPGMREEIETKQLTQQLEALRGAGKIGQA